MTCAYPGGDYFEFGSASPCTFRNFFAAFDINLGHTHAFQDAAAKMLRRDAAPRIAANIVELPYSACRPTSETKLRQKGIPVDVLRVHRTSSDTEVRL